MSRECATTATIRTGILAAAMALAAALIAALFYYASPGMAAASGTTMVVNTKQDEANKDGDCSLREAIEAADTNRKVDRCAAGSSAQKDVIRFSLGKRATITLGSELPSITDGAGLTVNGRKAKITISGNDSVRVFRVEPDAKLVLKKLTVAEGSAEDGGGIINNGGTLTVTNSTISGNSAGNFGGGIYNNEGTLTLRNATVSNNAVTSGEDQSSGGGIFNAGGTATLTNSTVSGNSADRGGGIAILRGTLTLKKSIISGNSAIGNGGGIINGGTLKVRRSTISGNDVSQFGGGIANGGTATVTNTTLSGNSAGVSGGGIDNTGGSMTVTYTTLYGNSAGSGGGIYNQSGTHNLSNTIITNSPRGGNCALGRRIINDLGYNISSDSTCVSSESETSLASTDPLLGALDNNGGPTKTHALQKGSPAIDFIPEGENGCGTKPKKDQRGVKRPQGNKCDTGSFEKQL